MTKNRQPVTASGYSLVELMLAIGILGVGLLLVATTLPAGMINNGESNQHTLATVIAENAVTICRASIRYNDLRIAVSAGIQAGPPAKSSLVDLTQYINCIQRTYPIPESVPQNSPNSNPMFNGKWYRDEDTVLSNVDGKRYPRSRLGWLVAARAVLPRNWSQATDALPNDFELVIVPFRKFIPESRSIAGGEVSFLAANFSAGQATQMPAANPARPVPLDSPIINLETAFFAYVVTKDGKGVSPSFPNYSFTPTPPNVSPMNYVPDGAAICVIEKDQNGNVLTESPAIGCYVYRTALRQ